MREKFFLSIFWTVSTLPPAVVISAEILSMATMMFSSLPAVSNMNKPSYRYNLFMTQNFFGQLGFPRAEPAQNIIRYFARAVFPANPEAQPRELTRAKVLLNGLQ